MSTPVPSSAASRSAIVGGTAAGHHLLDIDGYSHTKEVPNGQCIRSRPFIAGGHLWRVHYYPDGLHPGCKDFISIYLSLEPNGSSAMARAKFSLLDQAGEPVPSHTRTTDLQDFSDCSFGCDRFVNREYLVESEHILLDDRLTIRCDVVVTVGLRAVDRRASSSFVTVPPSDLQRHLADLLASGDGADVTFEVGDKKFSAHRYVLAARSAVFKAELFGRMKEGTTKTVVRIDDMEAQVFRALLTFMYTDTLPAGHDDSKQQAAIMAQHLLVAADRYTNLERLKLLCEDKLCDHIDATSVVTVLALADQHNCCGLKEACFQFLSYPSTLDAIVASGDFEHLSKSCPALWKELMANISACLPTDSSEAK